MLFPICSQKKKSKTLAFKRLKPCLFKIFDTKVKQKNLAK